MNSTANAGSTSQANQIIISILEKSKLQNDFILENIKGICAVINEEGVIFKANQDLASILKIPLTQIREYSIRKLFLPNTWEHFISKVKSLKVVTVNSHTSFEVKTDALIAEEQKSLLFESYYYGQYKNEPMHFYFILGTDITSLRTIEEKLKDQIEENKKLVRIITHDLASPLTVIDGISRNLTRENVDVKTCQTKILKSSSTIKEILSSVRNLQAIIDGVKKINLANYSLDKLVNDTLVQFEERLNEKNITLDYFPSHLNTLVDGNTLRNQVLSNLISNAIKFTFPGGTIAVSTAEEGNFVVIKIRDSGTGIRSANIPKLFVITQNCSTTGTSGEVGTGYGLPICKTILELMGGRISVSSKYIDEFPNEHGTEFCVYLQKADISKAA